MAAQDTFGKQVVINLFVPFECNFTLGTGFSFKCTLHEVLCFYRLKDYPEYSLFLAADCEHFFPPSQRISKDNKSILLYDLHKQLFLSQWNCSHTTRLAGLASFHINNLLSFLRGNAKQYLVMTSTSIYFMITQQVS